MTTTQTTRRTDLRPTNHAILRYLQRIDPRERRPKERLRELVQRAKEIDAEDVEGEALFDEETETLVVMDCSEIVTLWPSRRSE